MHENGHLERNRYNKEKKETIVLFYFSLWLQEEGYQNYSFEVQLSKPEILDELCHTSSGYSWHYHYL